ncbi:MAG TPA: hypothetical protein VGK09_04405 [Rhodocyclaceae bacterium]|jgi:hypothetical protein
MRIPEIENYRQPGPVGLLRHLGRSTPLSALVQRSKSALLAASIGAIGLIYLPAAHATPTYVYLYTGKSFNLGSFSNPGDPRSGGNLTMEITSPTPLIAGGDQKDTPGLRYSMSDGAFSFKYPVYQPPYDMVYPIFFYGNLAVFSLGSDGLPTSWNIQLGTTQGTHASFNQSLTSTYYADPYELSWDNSYVTQFGPTYIVNDPGQWHMYIETICRRCRSYRLRFCSASAALPWLRWHAPSDVGGINGNVKRTFSAWEPRDIGRHLPLWSIPAGKWQVKGS